MLYFKLTRVWGLKTFIQEAGDFVTLFLNLSYLVDKLIVIQSLWGNNQLTRSLLES